MIPSELTLGTQSDAEKKMFKLLKAVDLGGDATCLHSLELARHRYQRLGEIDFVIISALGLLVLEVKGGRVSRRNGIWAFRERWGKERRENRGPIKQVEANMWSLLDRLERQLKINIRNNHIVGFGVIFPDIPWNVSSTEWEDDWILDLNRLKRHGGLKGYLKDLYVHWGEKQRSHTRPIAGPLQTRIIKAMRPDFDLVPSLGQLGEAVDSQLVALTEKQYEKLDFVEGAPRVLIQGGAGSGKTMIACHVARREVAAGRSVNLICRSPLLATYLRNEVSDEVTVETIASSGVTAADVLVVDEGQDLINLDGLATLDGYVRGGLEEGRWRVFLDPNNQAGIEGAFDPEALEILIQSSFEPLRLTENCRNTRNIVEEVRALTGADTGVSIAGSGPEVETTFYAEPDQAPAQIAAFLDRIVAEGVDPAAIAILSPMEYEQSAVSALPERWKTRIRQLSEDNIFDYGPGMAVFATVSDFKGLDRRFVALTDITSIDQVETDITTLYVGLTRARAGLYISAHESTKPRIDELLALRAGNRVRTGR